MMKPTRTLLSAALFGIVLIASGCGESQESLIAKAKESIAKNEPKAAEIHMKNLLQKQDVAEARFLLGKALAAQGDWRSAEKEYRLAHTGGYDREKSLMALADALLYLGEHAKALEEANKLAPTTNEQKADAQALIGRIQLGQGKRDEAAKAFAAALGFMPTHAQAGIGAITLKAGTDLPGAAADLEKLLATHPTNTEAQQLKGEFEFAQGRKKEAIEIFRKVAAADSNNRQVRARLAALASESKDYAEAQKWIDELKKLTGPAPFTLYLQSMNDLRQNKLEPARDGALRALKAAPDFVPAAAVAATSLMALNSFEQAESQAKMIVEKAPNSTLGYRLLGAIYLKMNAPDKAMQVLSGPIDKGARDGAMLSLAGEAALKLNDPAKAVVYFTRAAEVEPNDPSKKTGLAIARVASGDRDRGLHELEEIATKDEDSGQADLALISQHLQAKKWAEALAAIDRLEKKQPKNPLVPNLRGSTLLGKGDLPGARAAFEAALKLDPTFFAAASNLATLDLRDKKPDQAKKRFADIVEKDPKNIPAMLSIARIAQSQGGSENKEMFEWLKKAREVDRTSIPAAIALSGYYFGNNQPKEAIPVLQEAVTAHPERIELLDALGTAYLRAGDDAQAIATFDRILRLKPDSAPLQARMGQFYLKRREFDRALTYFKKSAELAPKALEPKAGIASALIGMGKVNEARAIAAAIQAESPKDPAGATLEGEILAANKQWAESAAAYRKSLAIQKSPSVTMKLDQVLRAGGKEAEANALLKSLLAEAGNDVTVRNYAGMIEIANKHWPEAIAHYKAVLERSPKHPLALNNLAWALMEMKDPSALEYAERAVTLAPTSPEVLDTYGAVLLSRGDAGKAADMLKQAVDLAPKVPGYRLRYAEALVKRGDKSEARTQLDAVLSDTKSGPLFDQAQAMLKAL